MTHFSGNENDLVTLTSSETLKTMKHDGRTLLMNNAGSASTYTLPAATGSGRKFRFVVAAVNTSNYVIQVADTTDVMYGIILTNSTGDAPDVTFPWSTAADSDTITLDGTTQGGVAIGDWVELQDIATNKWAVFGVTNSSGSEATPFSAAV